MKRAQWGAIDAVFGTYGEHAAQNGKTYDLVDYLLFLSCTTEEAPGDDESWTIFTSFVMHRE